MASKDIEDSSKNLPTIGFLIFLYANTFLKGIGIIGENSLYKIILIIFFPMVILKIVHDKYTRSELMYVFLLITFGILSFYFSHKITLLITCVTLCGFKNIKIKKIFKNILLIRMVSLILMVLLALFGIIKNNVFLTWRNNNLDVRYGFGFASPNTLHMSFFIISILIITLYNKKIFKLSIILSILNCLLFSYTGSRTSLYLVFITIFLNIIVKQNSNVRKIIIRTLPLLFIMIMAFSFISAFKYTDSRFIQDVDSLLTGRIRYSNYYVSKYGISLMGDPAPVEDMNAIMDNGYIAVFFQYGIVGMALLIIYFLVVYKNINYIKNKEGMDVLLFLLPYSMIFFTESIISNIFMNLSLMVFGYIIFNNKLQFNIKAENEKS